ncbi:unnamed protein product, partial [Vitis vinifera]
MERLRDGIVIVHFYDLRHAEEAVMEIQEQYMQQQSRLRRFYEYDAMLFGHLGLERQSLVVPVAFPARGLIAGRAVWAQFSAPESTTPTPDGHNQGTLVISNLDSKLSESKLKEIVQNFGHVKEFREMTPKQQKWFVEFFDTRDAARAFSELDGKEIYDKKLIIKFSCSGGYGRIKSSTAAATATTSYNDINSRKIIHSRTALCSPHVTGGILQSCRSSSVAPSASVHLSQALLPTKRPTFRTENSSRKGIGRSNCGSIAPISSLSLGEDGSECTKSSGKFLRKVNYSHQKVPTVKQPRKRGQKNPDSHFLINVDAIAESNSRDTRTTVMIKNIPNKYSQKLLLNMLDNHCILSNEKITGDDEPLSSYDFVYLPIDFHNKCNVGYGFVNLTSPQAAWRLYKAFHLQQWEVFNSRKICEVTYARLQGLEALKQHFKNSKFACMVDDYLPVMFSPPRDGKQMSEPVPVVGCSISGISHGRHEEKVDGEMVEEVNGDNGDCSSNPSSKHDDE